MFQESSSSTKPHDSQPQGDLDRLSVDGLLDSLEQAEDSFLLEESMIDVLSSPLSDEVVGLDGVEFDPTDLPPPRRGHGRG